MSVLALGYMVIETKALGAWHDLLTGIMGLQHNHNTGPAQHYRLDDWQQRLTLQPAEEEGIGAVGWQVRDADALASMRLRLEAAGVTTTEGSTSLCEARGCEQLISFKDPISTIQTEVFWGPAIAQHPFRAGANISGYETGRLGLGHVVYFVGDYASGHTFYTQTLGFKTSDRIVWDGGEKDATFYHCNPRHHSLAIMPPFGNIPPGTFNHLMLQVSSLTDVGIMYDRVRQQRLPIMMNLGKHTNDHTESFYLITPSGFGLEIGCNSREIHGDWEPVLYDAPMIWGHEDPEAYR